MAIIRRKSKIIKIGKVSIGGNNPIAIQSMLKTKTFDVAQSITQIRELSNLGCEIVRLAVRDYQDAKALKKIKQQIATPIVADIHFNWRLALAAIDNGVDKVRLNPGNIFKRNEVCQIAKAARKRGIPIRVGLNSGSLPNFKLRNSKIKSVADSMVQEALNYIKIIERCGFYDIVISLKASNILDTVEAYRLMSGHCDYPFHLGVTATGLPLAGRIKSSIAIGALLLEGIGDTIRISLTGTPEEEVRAAKYILEALELRHFGPEIISCPTCGRCEVDLVRLVKEFEHKLKTENCKPLTVNSQPFRVALMGCVVNGPGEASSADMGIAFGKRDGLLFKNGKAIKKISYADCIPVLLKELGKKECRR